MTPEQKEKIIAIITEREKLRPLSRLARLMKDPFRALPYYILAAASRIKPYKISFKTLWGARMTGFLPEANTFYYYGYCEANVASFLLRYLKEGSVFIDVGAHIGFYSMLASLLVGDKGKVYSLEPTIWTYRLLRQNTDKLGNVISINAGASDASGELSFSDYGPGYGAYNSASAEGTMLRFKPKKTSVKSLELDSYFKQNSIRPDFIKLDAEGFERAILKGLKETLKLSRPLITLEMAGGEKWSDNCRQSSDMLFAEKYESYEMADDGFIQACDIKSSYAYTNILFIPQEKTGLVSHLIQ